MRLLIILILFVTWTVCEDDTELIEKNSTAVRVKRTFGSPTPDSEKVKKMTHQTTYLSKLLRTGISLERKWFDVMSQKSTAEVVVFLVLGIVSTFFVILTPLVLLTKLLAPPLVFRRKNRSIHDQLHLDFSLPQWMDQMESWMNTHKPLEDR
ncbi:uncharacterized protein LOC124197881 [Daphnia pulex]|uniref:uncharacterized protein LOC124197881 n=1 Tax=Daphnia pulex TaxID=6669 RepID=UPI001EE071C5|nr:uncharacterized protein LOC124197881 [Daphnia pulex]